MRTNDPAKRFDITDSTYPLELLARLATLATHPQAIVCYASPRDAKRAAWPANKDSAQALLRAMVDRAAQRAPRGIVRLEWRMSAGNAVVMRAWTTTRAQASVSSHLTDERQAPHPRVSSHLTEESPVSDEQGPIHPQRVKNQLINNGRNEFDVDIAKLQGETQLQIEQGKRGDHALTVAVKVLEAREKSLTAREDRLLTHIEATAQEDTKRFQILAAWSQHMMTHGAELGAARATVQAQTQIHALQSALLDANKDPVTKALDSVAPMIPALIGRVMGMDKAALMGFTDEDIEAETQRRAALLRAVADAENAKAAQGGPQATPAAPAPPGAPAPAPAKPR